MRTVKLLLAMVHQVAAAEATAAAEEERKEKQAEAAAAERKLQEQKARKVFVCVFVRTFVFVPICERDCKLMRWIL